MQYHYVVGYDSESMRWFVESDTTAYFPDGHVWDDNQYKESLLSDFVHFQPLCPLHLPHPRIFVCSCSHLHVPKLEAC